MFLLVFEFAFLLTLPIKKVFFFFFSLTILKKLFSVFEKFLSNANDENMSSSFLSFFSLLNFVDIGICNCNGIDIGIGI
jgi:hypothetical protein